MNLLEECISKREEQELIRDICNRKWSNSLKRKTQHYGYTYDYRKRSLSETEPIPIALVPKCIKDILNPDQMIINRYLNGESISPHTDSNIFGPVICSLSLGAPTIMEFSYGNSTYNIKLPRRSLLILKDDARYKAKHAIYHYGDTRYSITYRTFK